MSRIADAALNLNIIDMQQNTKIIMSVTRKNKQKQKSAIVFDGLLCAVCRKQDILNFENIHVEPH